VLNNQRKPKRNRIVPRAYEHRVDLVAKHLADLGITGMRQPDNPESTHTFGVTHGSTWRKIR
jgi:hypothetical protein